MTGLVRVGDVGAVLGDQSSGLGFGPLPEPNHDPHDPRTHGRSHLRIHVLGIPLDDVGPLVTVDVADREPG